MARISFAAEATTLTLDSFVSIFRRRTKISWWVPGTSLASPMILIAASSACLRALHFFESSAKYQSLVTPSSISILTLLSFSRRSISSARSISSSSAIPSPNPSSSSLPPPSCALARTRYSIARVSFLGLGFRCFALASKAASTSLTVTSFAFFTTTLSLSPIQRCNSMTSALAALRTVS